jgi:ribosomal protein S18 acetylase RimI-like enzyme
MLNDEPELIEPLPWDTAFFGFNIARVCRGRLTPDLVARILAACVKERFDCLYLLADSDDRVTIDLAALHGLRFVDIRHTLQLSLQTSPGAPSPIVRNFRPDDLPALLKIAAYSHTDSRFFFDPGFPDHLCARLYQTWIEKSCEGYAAAVLVAELSSRVAGYVTCDPVPGTTVGSIALCAVAEEFRGCGVGKALMNAALHRLRGLGVERVTVVTQGRNIAAHCCPAIR